MSQMLTKVSTANGRTVFASWRFMAINSFGTIWEDISLKMEACYRDILMQE